MGNIGKLVEKVSDAAAIRKRVVDHARAGPDENLRVGERSREINPAGVENADRLAEGRLIELVREVK